ncbi:hydrogenase/urease accessory protein HupE [Sporosarcina luteola]|nr:hydrogenase/urease accessory protein HupE [Sporosarcina luteola]
MMEKAKILSLIGLIAIIGNWVGYKVNPIEALPGMILIVLVTVIGLALATYLPLKIPAVIWISFIALLATTPIFPGNAWIVDQTSKINFMAIATPILAYAGLSLGKDINDFKKLGWRIVIVSLVVYTGTFLFAAVFAEIIFRIQGRF